LFFSFYTAVVPPGAASANLSIEHQMQKAKKESLPRFLFFGNADTIRLRHRDKIGDP